MTDHIDYTQRPEVLKCLGWQWVNCSDPQDDGYWEDAKGDLRIDGYEEYPPTMQELWEGLCKACLIPGIGIPVLHEKLYITIQNGPEHHEIFKVRHFGTLRNTIAAALHWVLQQRKESK